MRHSCPSLTQHILYYTSLGYQLLYVWTYCYVVTLCTYPINLSVNQSDTVLPIYDSTYTILHTFSFLNKKKRRALRTWPLTYSHRNGEICERPPRSTTSLPGHITAPGGNSLIGATNRLMSSGRINYKYFRPLLPRTPYSPCCMHALLRYACTFWDNACYP